MAVRTRLHRSELAVPGSSTRMLEKAPDAGADVVFLDLEDAVAPDDKEQARENVIAALNEQDWSACSVSVRINGLDTHYCYRDIVEVVERAGDKLDTILIPKVGTPSDVEFVATLMSQIEAAHGLAADQPAHPDRDRAGDGQRRGDRPGLPRPAGGDGVRRRRLRRVDPGPHHQYRRRQPRVLGADRCRRRRSAATATGATSGTSPCRGWWSPAAPMACGRSTGRSATTPIPTGTWRPPAAALSSAARASGRSTPPRSRWPTASSRPPTRRALHARRILAAMEQAATEGKGAVSLDGRLIDAASIKMAENLVQKLEQMGAPA